MSTEIPVRQSEAGPTNPIIGYLSAILAIIPICAITMAVVFSDSLPGGDLFGGMLILVILGLLLICTPLALILGVIVLRQKNRRKGFAAIGVSLSALTIISVCIFFIRLS